MVHVQWPGGRRHRRAAWRPVLVVVGAAVLLAMSSVAFARWTINGVGAAVARTGPFDLVGTQPTAHATEQDVSVSWEQSRLIGRWLGNYRAGGYRVRRYDTTGRPQDTSTACSGRLAGREATVHCIEHGVPEGTWNYSVTPVLGGWTGAEGPRTAVTVKAATATLTSPADGSATLDRRPTLRGTMANASVGITVTISRGRVLGSATQTLPATAAGRSWSAQPVGDLPEGAYTVRVRQTDRAGHTTWSPPSTFTVDTTPPATTDDTVAISEEWKQTGQSVALRPTDPGGSGLAATYFTTDGSTPTTGSTQGNSVNVREGVHVIRYFSVDKAGNTEAVRTATERIRVDETVPNAATLGRLPDLVRNGQVLAGNGDDALSGVARVIYEICADAACASWMPIGSSTAGPNYSLVWRGQPTDGSYQVRISALDAASNTTSSTPQTVRVDNTAPTVTNVTSIGGDGTLAVGDVLLVEMSEPLDSASLPAEGSLKLSRPSGDGTTMTISGLTQGPVDTGTAAWVADGASVTYSGALTLIDNGRRVRFTVGSCDSGCGDVIAGAEGTLHFDPAASMRDPAGNAASGTPPSTLTLF
jgi:hypothetical protein